MAGQSAGSKESACLTLRISKCSQPACDREHLLEDISLISTMYSNVVLLLFLGQRRYQIPFNHGCTMLGVILQLAIGELAIMQCQKPARFLACSINSKVASRLLIILVGYIALNNNYFWFVSGTADNPMSLSSNSDTYCGECLKDGLKDVH